MSAVVVVMAVAAALSGNRGTFGGCGRRPLTGWGTAVNGRHGIVCTWIFAKIWILRRVPTAEIPVAGGISEAALRRDIVIIARRRTGYEPARIIGKGRHMP
jgi:hypothetical protein